jgi:hypothetical protein
MGQVYPKAEASRFDGLGVTLSAFFCDALEVGEGTIRAVGICCTFCNARTLRRPVVR